MTTFCHAWHVFLSYTDPDALFEQMCRHEYAAHWPHYKTHCPNLLPNGADLEMFPSLTANAPINVDVVYKEFTNNHTSLVGFWNDWYNEYVNAPFPRLIVRFEDIIFHPRYVTKLACECAGGELNKTPFRYITDSAKKGAAAHGKKSERTGYVDALIKYGTEAGRYTGMEPADLEYAREALDPNLMKLFGYKHAVGTTKPQYRADADEEKGEKEDEEAIDGRPDERQEEDENGEEGETGEKDETGEDETGEEES